MKDTFHGWSTVGQMDIDVVADLIATGRKVSDVKPDDWLINNFIGFPDQNKLILDFGCGFGRNAFGMAKHSKKWTIIGYDNEAMLSKVPEFATINYKGELPENLLFMSDWNRVSLYKVDVIVCTLVLQHIYEHTLIKYIQNFKKMTHRLVVSGRRFNDDATKRSTWTILEEEGLIPDKFYGVNEEMPYTAEGDPEEHNTAVYVL